jgi:lipoyl(octanoyl) transferase
VEGAFNHICIRFKIAMLGAMKCSLSPFNKDVAPVEWLQSPDFVDYPQAVAQMDARAAAIRAGDKSELVWLLEHPPLYTAGTSAKKQDLLDARFPVFETGRGGQYTYHGPGQRIAYVMLDLMQRRTDKGPDLKSYICALEDWLIQTLKEFDVKGERRAGRVGIWVATSAGEKKIAAVGVRVRRWVTMHGISLNVNPDLSHFSGIVPCGLRDYGVTSFFDLGIAADMEDIDAALKRNFSKVF